MALTDKVKNRYQDLLRLRMLQLSDEERKRDEAAESGIPNDFAEHDWFVFQGGPHACYCSACNHRPIRKGESVAKAFPLEEGSLEVVTYDCFRTYWHGNTTLLNMNPSER